MASRKPLVIISGVVQQLPAGDSLNASVSEVDVTTMTNGEAGAVVCGAPVYVFSSGTAKKAQASALASSYVAGLMKDVSTAGSAVGNVQTDGVLSLTTAQWDAVTGQTGGLTAGSMYYLDAATAGKLTTTAPSTTGQYVVPVGKAISSTDMDITPTLPIGL